MKKVLLLEKSLTGEWKMFLLLWLSFSAWILLAWSFHKIKSYLVVIFKVFQKCSDESGLLLKVHARIWRSMGLPTKNLGCWGAYTCTGSGQNDRCLKTPHPSHEEDGCEFSCCLTPGWPPPRSISNSTFKTLHFWHNFSLLIFKAWDSNFRRGGNTLLQLTGHLEQ